MPYTRAGIAFAAGSDTSYEAGIRAHQFVQAQGIAVYRWVKSRGAYGSTQKEAEAALHMGRPSLCARFKALEEVQAIRKTEQRRAGCTAYVVTGQRVPVQMELMA